MHITFLPGLVPCGREDCCCGVPRSRGTQEFPPGRRRSRSASISCRCVRSQGPKKKIADSTVLGEFPVLHLPGETRIAKMFPLWHSGVVRARFLGRCPGFSCGVPRTTMFPRGSPPTASTASAAVFGRGRCLCCVLDSGRCIDSWWRSELSSGFEVLRLTIPEPSTRRALAVSPILRWFVRTPLPSLQSPVSWRIFPRDSHWHNSCRRACRD